MAFELQQCCIAVAAECRQAQPSPSSNVQQSGLLLAAPESRFSAAASAAADLHLQVTGVFGAPPRSAAAAAAAAAAVDDDDDGAHESGASAAAPPFLNYAPQPLPPSAPRTYILLDCGIRYNHDVAPHMPLMMVHALAKVQPRTTLTSAVLVRLLLMRAHRA